MKISVSEFKAKCTQMIRQVAEDGDPLEIMNRGRVVARVQQATEEPPPDPKTFFGSLKGTVSFQPGWDEPLGEADWEASQ